MTADELDHLIEWAAELDRAGDQLRKLKAAGVPGVDAAIYTLAKARMKLRELERSVRRSNAKTAKPKPKTAAKPKPKTNPKTSKPKTASKPKPKTASKPRPKTASKPRPKTASRAASKTRR